MRVFQKAQPGKDQAEEWALFGKQTSAVPNQPPIFEDWGLEKQIMGFIILSDKQNQQRTWYE